MDGILIVDKPQGVTSHDVVDFVRKRFALKKVGHAGTLDPGASGVLIILIGKYTKRFAELSSQDKEYTACLTLGVSTDSLDGQGQIIEQKQLPPLELDKVKQVFAQFIGKIEQIPPMFSALRYKGKKLYTLARKGLEVERHPRRVYIYQLKITKFDLPHIYFVVSCSKGTYIRSLCADIARSLGCPGYMSQLRRVRSGSFTIHQAVTLDRLKDFSEQQLQKALLR